jgi:CheY-like chemotaxis protein
MSFPVWDATKNLKSRPDTRRIPVIGVTAHAMAGNGEKAKATGCAHYDTKPIDLKRLFEKIEALLPKEVDA